MVAGRGCALPVPLCALLALHHITRSRCATSPGERLGHERGKGSRRYLTTSLISKPRRAPNLGRRQRSLRCHCSRTLRNRLRQVLLAVCTILVRRASRSLTLKEAGAFQLPRPLCVSQAFAGLRKKSHTASISKFVYCIRVLHSMTCPANKQCTRYCASG